MGGFMKIIEKTMKIENIVASYPETARVFIDYEIGFCCSGNDTITQICQDRKINASNLVIDLCDAILNHETGKYYLPDNASVPDIIAILQFVYHKELKNDIELAFDLSVRASIEQGSNHPNLYQIVKDLEELRFDLFPHLNKEEKVIFPWFLSIFYASENHGEVENIIRKNIPLKYPIWQLQYDHDFFKAALKNLHDLTDCFLIQRETPAIIRELTKTLQRIDLNFNNATEIEDKVLNNAMLKIETKVLSDNVHDNIRNYMI